VGAPEILTQLKRIAPVFAVRGNVDRGPWAEELPLTTVVEISGCHFYVLHNLRELDLNPQVGEFDAVISGHTHQADQHEESGVLYLNPGSAGPRRFQLPISVGRLDVVGGRVRATLIDLGARRGRTVASSRA